MGAKGQLRTRAKAIRVPPVRTGCVLFHAFTRTNDVRHVQVEAGVHTIGKAAWQHCNRLQIVQPSTVVCLQDGAVQGSPLEGNATLLSKDLKPNEKRNGPSKSCMCLSRMARFCEHFRLHMSFYVERYLCQMSVLIEEGLKSGSSFSSLCPRESEEISMSGCPSRSMLAVCDA